MKSLFKQVGLWTLALGLGTTAFADPPSNTANPRNAFLFNGLFISNGVPATTNISSYTNLYLSAPYQHKISVTTVITGTNVIPAAYLYTNYFDLGKVTSSNGVYTTNWTSDTPIVVTGAGVAAVNSNQVQARILSETNFDGYELIRLTKAGANATNAYTWQVILGQTP